MKTLQQIQLSYNQQTYKTYTLKAAEGLLESLKQEIES